MGRYDYQVPTGVVIPDTATVIDEVNAEWRLAFGDDFNVAPETPQGVMISAEVAARTDFVKNNAALANQINPEIAGGVFLDAICALLGLERRAETKTRVANVSVFGQPLTVLPAAVRARTAGGDLFESVGTIQLDSSGVASVDFIALEGGAVPCGAGSLIQIVDAVLGWETVFNPESGILGTDGQSDESLRMLRRVTLAKQGISTVEGIVSDLYDTEGVRSLQFRENITATPLAIPSIIFPGNIVTLVPHSIWVCVDGGTDADIAATLLRNKTAGAGWNGDISVTVVDPSSEQEYEVLFDRSTPVPMLVKVTVRVGLATVDVQNVMRAAVLAYARGEIPGERGFVTGGGVSPFEIAGAAAPAAPGVFVVKVEVAPASTGVYQTAEYEVDLDQVATLEPSSITVVVL